jgi:hypothetical protein
LAPSTWAAVMPDDPAPMMQAVLCPRVMDAESTPGRPPPGRRVLL